MRKMIWFTAFVLALAAPSFAHAMPTAECGALWKAEKAKPGFVPAEKGKGMAAWQAFRKEHCPKNVKAKGDGASLETLNLSARGKRK